MSKVTKKKNAIIESYFVAEDSLEKYVGLESIGENMIEMVKYKDYQDEVTGLKETILELQNNGLKLEARIKDLDEYVKFNYER